MQNFIDSNSHLRNSLIEAFANSDAPQRAQSLRHRPLVVFGPRSSLGMMHIKGLITKGANCILAVDDYCESAEIEGIPVCNSKDFLQKAGSLKEAVAIDFTQTPYARALYRQLAHHAGMEYHDLLKLLAAFEAAGVYEAVPIYRQRTLALADDWLKLADRLADNHSRETLYALLLQRIEYNRDWLDGIMIGGRDEYFGSSSNSDTFSLGNREHFIDGGAHRGTIITRMLATTNWRYAGIHAFEPDRENFAALSNLTPVPLPNLQLHNAALSEHAETLRFNETGTMGSRISDQGSVTVPCLRLDDVVEQATFIKLDVEGFEARTLRGASSLISSQRPRMAIASYHYAHDLLEITATIDAIAPDYRFFLRHHFGYFYDTILYATPRDDWRPLPHSV